MSATDKSPLLIRLIRILLLAVPVVTFLTIGIGYARQHLFSLVLDHYLHHRAGTCTLRESFESLDISLRQRAGTDEIHQALRLMERDGRGFEHWDTPQGEFWLPGASADAIQYDLAEQARNIYGTGPTGVHAGDVVIDAGANIGVFTRKALAAGAQLVVAIEPGPENVECLRRTFAAEIAAHRVIVYPKGIWDKDDVLKLGVDAKDSARDSFVRPVENASYIEVPLTTVDKLAAELNLPRVDFIKMDIEGAEQRAIAGARQTIAKYRPRMALCIYHLVDDPVKIPRLVQDTVSGYQTRISCLCAPDRIQPEVAFFY
jgi:FkbM family methyltransferase